MKWTILPFVVFVAIVVMLSCEKSGSSGQSLYNQHCANCHLGNGEGLGELIPSIVNSSVLATSDSLACMIRNGVKSENEGNSVFEGYSMPPNNQLSEIEITNIINYARGEFLSNSQPILLPQVKKSLENCN